MINLLSLEKKKKEPDLPLDSPALKTIDLFASGSRLLRSVSLSKPSLSRKKSKTSGAYSLTVISSFIVRLLFWFVYTLTILLDIF